MVIQLEIPMATPLLNTWERMHWMRRAKLKQDIADALTENWEDMLDALCPDERSRLLSMLPIPKVGIEIFRYSAGSPTHPEPDEDNLVGGTKPLIDALLVRKGRRKIGLGIIEDDNPEIVVRRRVEHRQGERGNPRTIIRITPEVQ